MNLLSIHPQINKNIFYSHILTKLMGNISIILQKCIIVREM